MWHRLSVHVKKQEPGSNQMAVIRPLTNTYHDTGMEFSDLSTKTLYNVTEEDESDLIRYNPPVSPHLTNSKKSSQIQSSVFEPVKERDTKELHTPKQHHSSVFPQQVIADHFQEVVAKLNSSMSDLDDIITFSQPDSAVMLPYQPLNEKPKLSHYANDPDPLEMEELEVDSEQFELLHGYMYGNAQIHDDDELEQMKLAMEDTLALMPPSPFRDSAGSVGPIPNSPLSESILCTPPSVMYASVIFEDYKQSFSTL